MALSTERRILAAVGGGSGLLVFLLLLPGPLASRAFACVATAFPVALMALGARRRGRLGSLAWVFLALLVVLEGAVAAIFLLAGSGSDGAPFGLPPATVALLAGLWLLPLPLVALAYGLTFDRFGITPADLERLRKGREGAEASPSDAGPAPPAGGPER